MLASGALLMGYWVLWPYNIITVKSPIHVISKTVKPGGLLVYEVEYCKYMSLPAIVTMQLIDMEIHFFPAITVNLPKGCTKSIRRQELPMRLAPDFYHLHISSTYQPNPLRSITYDWDTELFQVMQ